VVDNFNVKFDMFAKINVNGDQADPLWKYLKSKQGGTLGEYVLFLITYSKHSSGSGSHNM